MEPKLQLLQIVEDTIVDGPGFRTSFYAAGCNHHCQDCHNPQSWSFTNGATHSVDNLIARALQAYGDITFTGGDPLFQIEGFIVFAQAIKQRSTKNIWCYTGFTFEEICQSPSLARILPYIDVIVDGRFEAALQSEHLLYRGSSNQRIIDIKKSIVQQAVVQLDFDHLLSVNHLK